MKLRAAVPSDIPQLVQMRLDRASVKCLYEAGLPKTGSGRCFNQYGG